jgi:hypothetical protein
MYKNGKFMNLFYTFIKNNIKNINEIKTENVKYLLKNGDLHSFDGFAVIYNNKDKHVIKPNEFYINGIHHDLISFNNNRDKIDWDTINNRINILNKILKT